MATQDQLNVARRGGGRMKMAKGITVTMVAGAAVTDSTFTPPEGSRISAIKWHTPVLFSGAPTNINLTIGKTAAATQYVAATDVKGANAPTVGTLVAAPDYASWPAGQALFITLTAVGGTAPAGSCVVEIEYAPANP